MAAFLAHFPRWAQIIPVFGLIVLVVYSWTLMPFFWKLPSWLHYLRVDEVFILLAYSLATNFAESLAVLCGLLVPALLLPGRWFREAFVARGAALALAGLGCMMFLAEQFTDKDAYPTFWLQAPVLLLAALLVAGLVYLAGRLPGPRRFLEALADRVSIFTYVAVPLSLLAVLVVGLRLILG